MLDRIIAQAESVADHLRATGIRSSKIPNDRIHSYYILNKFRASEALIKLTDLVSTYPAFTDIWHKRLLSPDQSRSIEPEAICDIIVLNLLLNGDLLGLLESLERVSITRRFFTDYFKPLYGIAIESEIEIAKDIYLTPWSNVPDCKHKQHYSEPRSFFSSLSFAPSAAIRIRRSTINCIESMGDYEWSVHVQSTNPLLDIEDIHYLISICVSDAVLANSIFLHHGDRCINMLLPSPTYSPMSVSDFSIASACGKALSINHDSIQNLFLAWNKLNKNDLQSVRVACGRMLRTLGNIYSPENCVELAIALEALFVSSDENSSAGEIRYKLSIRAAFFIEIDRFDRETIFNDIKALYVCRSNILHGSRKSKKISSDIYDRLSIYVWSALKRIVQLGKIPNFDKEYILRNS